MCNYPVSNIQYPLFNDGGANWILAVGYWHIQHMLSFPAHGVGQGETNTTKEKSNMTESDGRDRINTENRSERRPILWYNTQYSDR